MLLFFMEYFGDVGIDLWEYLLSVIYFIFIYLYFARKKNMNIKLHPEYKYYISGLVSKLLSGVFFSLIYFYYYPGGDTMSYFFSGVAMNKMLALNPVEFFRQVVFGDHSMRALNEYATQSMRPYSYVFTDSRTFQVVRISAVLSLLTFNSYLISTLIMASLSFLGIWLGYRTFCSYFPELMGKLAIGFLFMPSAIFWGSGIMKDTFTFSAVCIWVHAIDELFFKHRNYISRMVLLYASGAMIVMIKPYIFMVILPATLLWVLYMRVVRMKNIMVRFVILPVFIVTMLSSTIYILSNMSDLMDKFALDDAIDNMKNIQNDMMNNESYGSRTNTYSVGEFDGTWIGVVKKFPVATNAALFRPYIWESRSAVIALSGLENLFILGLTLYVLFTAGLRFTLRCISAIPLLLMSMTFAILFAFVVGVSTPNFGALVRFKIPMMPFYISSMYIILYLYQEKKWAKHRGIPFDLADYRMGTPKTTLVRKKPVRRARQVPLSPVSTVNTA